MGNWAGNTMYRSDAAGITYQPPPQQSYFGWAYPGNGVIELLLHGEGEVTVDVGNAYTNGWVQVDLVTPNRVDAIASVASRTMSTVVKHHFSDGDKLRISEVRPRAVIVINSISFNCPTTTTTTGELVAQEGSTQYVSGASWSLSNISCADYVRIASEPARPWGSQMAIIDKSWCGDSCLQMRDDCEGFLYPDPGEGDHACVQIRKIPSDNDELKERVLQTSDGICDLDMSKWAAHVLKDTSPTNYPEVLKSTE